MEERITALESSISSVTQELISLKELLGIGLKKVDSNFGVINNKLSTLEKKINELAYKLDNLDGNTNKGFNEVGDKIESLTEEIQKIGIVTQYDEMYKNQQGLKN